MRLQKRHDVARYDNYLRWVCGFANAEGGVLIIARDDKGRIVGSPDAARFLEELPNKIRDLLGIAVAVNLHEEAGEIEAWGRGIKRIFAACRQAGTPKPRIRVDAGFWTEILSKWQLEK